MHWCCGAVRVLEESRRRALPALSVNTVHGRGSRRIVDSLIASPRTRVCDALAGHDASYTTFAMHQDDRM
jgi:hypothetical protein